MWTERKRAAWAAIQLRYQPDREYIASPPAADGAPGYVAVRAFSGRTVVVLIAPDARLPAGMALSPHTIGTEEQEAVRDEIQGRLRVTVADAVRLRGIAAEEDDGA